MTKINPTVLERSSETNLPAQTTAKDDLRSFSENERHQAGSEYHKFPTSHCEVAELVEIVWIKGDASKTLYKGRKQVTTINLIFDDGLLLTVKEDELFPMDLSPNFTDDESVVRSESKVKSHNFGTIDNLFSEPANVVLNEVKDFMEVNIKMELPDDKSEDFLESSIEIKQEVEEEDDGGGEEAVSEDVGTREDLLPEVIPPVLASSPSHISDVHISVDAMSDPSAVCTQRMNTEPKGPVTSESFIFTPAIPSVFLIPARAPENPATECLSSTCSSFPVSNQSAKDLHGTDGLPSAVCTKNDTGVWPHEAVLLLIEEYRRKRCNFHKIKSLFMAVVAEMKKQGYSYTWEQAEKKWRNLRGTYRRVKDSKKKKTGLGKQRWSYFQAFDEIIQTENAIIPVNETNALENDLWNVPGNDMQVSSSFGLSCIQETEQSEDRTGETNGTDSGYAAQCLENVTRMISDTSSTECLPNTCSSTGGVVHVNEVFPVSIQSAEDLHGSEFIQPANEERDTDSDYAAQVLENVTRMISDPATDCLPSTSLSIGEVVHVNEDIVFPVSFQSAKDLHGTECMPLAHEDRDTGVWSHEAVLLLIEAYRQKHCYFNKNKSLFKAVVAEMKEKGYSYTWDQADKKWRNLKGTYRRVKESKRKIGKGKQKWAYFQAFDKLLQTQHYNIQTTFFPDCQDAPLNVSGEDMLDSSSVGPSCIQTAEQSEGRMGDTNDTDSDCAVQHPMISDPATECLPSTCSTYPVSSQSAKDFHVNEERDTGVWSHEAVLLLIEEYRQKRFNFNKNKSLFKAVVAEMNKRGYSYTWDQAEKKWRNLKGTYRRVKESKRKVGRGKQRWSYFQAFDEIIQTENAIPPINETNALESNQDAPLNVPDNDRLTSSSPGPSSIQATEQSEGRVGESNSTDSDYSAQFLEIVTRVISDPVTVWVPSTYTSIGNAVHINEGTEYTSPINEECYTGAWPHEAVLLLIQEYRQKRCKFKKPKSLFMAVVAEMNKKGYSYTWDQAEKKWRNLKGSYRRIIDAKRKTGQGEQKWPYFQAFDELLQTEHAITPANETSTSESNLDNPLNIPSIDMQVSSSPGPSSIQATEPNKGRTEETNGTDSDCAAHCLEIVTRTVSDPATDCLPSTVLRIGEVVHVNEGSVYMPPVIEENDTGLWPHEAVLLLIEEYCHKQCNYKKGKSLFMAVVAEMNTRGYSYTWEQADKKWRNLKGTYRRIRETKRKNGTGKQRWPYYEAFHELYQGEFYNIQTTFFPDDTQASSSPGPSSIQAMEQSEDRTGETNETVTIKTAKGKRKADPTPTWVKKWEARRRMESREFLEELRKENEKRNDLLRELLKKL